MSWCPTQSQTTAVSLTCDDSAIVFIGERCSPGQNSCCAHVGDPSSRCMLEEAISSDQC